MALLKKEKAKIFYEQLGHNGPWVTFINGYTRSSSDFRLIAKKLVLAGYRVLVFDNRGSGRTEVEEEFSVQDMANDVIDLWDALSISKSHVIGFSMGGIIAQQLAAGNISRIQSLILVSSARSISHLVRDTAWPKSADAIMQKLERYFHHSFFHENKALVEAMAKQIASANFDGLFEKSASLQRSAIISMQSQKVDLSDYKKPALVFHGESDEVTPLEQAEELAAAIPNAKLQVYKRTGHLLLLEKRDRLLNDILDFMKSARED